MKRKVILILLIFGVLGYFGRGATDRIVRHLTLKDGANQSETMLSLLDFYCRPFAKYGLYFPPAGMVRMNNSADDAVVWIEPETKTALEISDRWCTVSNLYAEMPEPERADFDSLFQNYVARRFPNLMAVKLLGTEPTEHDRMWKQDPPKDLRRLSLIWNSRQDPWSEHRVTRLSINGRFEWPWN